MSLLDEAKKIKGERRGVQTNETIELSLAWLKGEISYSQMTKVLNTTGSNVYNFIARNLVVAYLQGKIKIEE